MENKNNDSLLLSKMLVKHNIATSDVVKVRNIEKNKAYKVPLIALNKPICKVFKKFL